MRTGPATVTALLLAALAVTGCDDRDEQPVLNVPATDQAPARVEREPDPATCANIEAQRATNQRLHRDGYAEDYSKEYDQLADAAGCD